MTLSHLFVLQNCLLNNLMTLYLYLVTRLNPITMSSELELKIACQNHRLLLRKLTFRKLPIHNCYTKLAFTP
ncbi:hypothetical protein CICLE_v10024351mg [Citrus x clementina]|uniref:Uncharacterized protein n=2 Tax=Citrus TaxID=2706 RepID=V4TZP5_CITCL|nr:hypothetical protein CICLE_v10024351mg [Citrus x clementina]GAY68750.1 hypothetical protein CUMW_266600 [Citrus unshiu]